MHCTRSLLPLLWSTTTSSSLWWPWLCCCKWGNIRSLDQRRICRQRAKQSVLAIIPRARIQSRCIQWRCVEVETIDTSTSATSYSNYHTTRLPAALNHHTETLSTTIDHTKTISTAIIYNSTSISAAINNSAALSSRANQSTANRQRRRWCSSHCPIGMSGCHELHQGGILYRNRMDLQGTGCVEWLPKDFPCSNDRLHDLGNRRTWQMLSWWRLHRSMAHRQIRTVCCRWVERCFRQWSIQARTTRSSIGEQSSKIGRIKSSHHSCVSTTGSESSATSQSWNSKATASKCTAISASQ